MGRRGGFGSRRRSGSPRSGSKSGGGGFFGRGKTKTKAKTPAGSKGKGAPAPARAGGAPAPANVGGGAGGGGMLGGLGGMIMQGMAFGTGSAIAHRAVDAVAGPRTVEHQHVGEQGEGAAAPAQNFAEQQGAPADTPCMQQTQQFAQCVQENAGNVGACQFFFDLLSQCQVDSGAK